MRPKYTSRAATLPLILTLAALSACGDKTPKQTAGAPAREIQLAPSAPAQPQLNDAPAQAAVAPEHAKKVAKTPPERAPEPRVIVRPLNAQDNPSVAAAA